MAVRAHFRRETQSVARFAEARIITRRATNIRRRAMAIGRPQISQRIEHQSEWIHLPMAVLLNVCAIGMKAVAVARIHRDRTAIDTTMVESLLNP